MTRSWLASTSDKTKSAPPPRPKMPNPGITNISISRQPIPERNISDMSQPDAPPKKRLQKNSTKQTKATNAPMPSPGVWNSKYSAAMPINSSSMATPLEPKAPISTSAQPGSTSAGSFSNP